MRWLALLLLVGCGDNLQGITIEQRQAAETTARCGQLTRCGLFRDVATCVSFVRPKDEAPLFAAVDTNKVTYSPTAEQLCVEALERTSCDRTALDNRVRPLSCAGALRGTRAPGSACAFDAECTTGRCALEACPRTECCPGMCKPLRGALGSSCQRNDDCLDDAYCGQDGTCAALVKSGSACSSDVACEIGLACISGICRALPKTGESCPYGRCAFVGDRCSSDGACVPVGLPGDACVDDTQCSPYARCDGGTCIDIPALGMPCDGRCAGATFCKNGVCVMPLDNGQPCNADNECASQLCAEGPIFDECIARRVCY